MIRLISEFVSLYSMWRKILLIVCAGLILCIFLINTQGCIKEYSYEGGPIDTTDTIPQDTTDTIPQDTLDTTSIYSQCELCKGIPDYTFKTWSFKIDTFSFCGGVTGAVMNVEHTGFTFFGPSSCSIDTGLIITVYLDTVLNKDISNYTEHHVTMQYYNRVGTQDMFLADQHATFVLTIQSYNYATGTMKGEFSGIVATDKQTKAKVESGKFYIEF